MRRAILAIVATAAGLVVLLSFKTHSPSGSLGVSPAAVIGTPTSGTGSGSKSGAGASPAASGSPAASATSSGTSGSGSGGSAKTVTGDAVQTFYGPVQVQITVKGGKVTRVNVLQYPDGTPRDYEINSYAIPALEQETIGTTTASINGISGATFTSQGYIGSLQSAINKAGL